MNELKANDPKLAERLIISEQTIQKWINENQGWQNLREDLDTIPVVVHVSLRRQAYSSWTLQSSRLQYVVGCQQQTKLLVF